MRISLYFILSLIFLADLGFGQGLQTEILAVEGRLVGDGSGLRYGEIGKVCQNLNGEVCFKATLQDAGVPKQAIVRISGGQTTVIALEGEIQNNFKEDGDQGVLSNVKNTRYRTFGDPIISNSGRMAFLAEFQLNFSINVRSNSLQVLVTTGDTPGDLWIVDRSGRTAKTGDSQEVEGFYHARLGDLSFDSDGALFYRSVLQRLEADQSISYRNMIYRAHPLLDSIDQLTRNNFVDRGEIFKMTGDQAAQEIPTQVAYEMSDSGELRILASDVNGSTLTSIIGATEETLIKTGDSLPYSPTTLVMGVRGFLANIGTNPVYLVETASGGVNGQSIVSLNAEGILSELARTGQTPPGMGEGWIFKSFQMPVSGSDNACGFVATLADAGGIRLQSVWRKITVGVDPRPIATEGEQVPGAAAGVTYRSFGALMMNQLGQVIFSARLNHGHGINSQNDFAYYLAEPNRSVTRIFGKGDLFFFGFLQLQPITELGISELSEAGELTLNLKSTQGKSALVQFAIEATNFLHYDQWAEAHIPDLDARNREDDADGDGEINLFEYAYGTDPEDPDSAVQPQMILTDEAGYRRLSIEFNRLTIVSDIDYLVEFSSDLISWQSGAGKTEETHRGPTSSDRALVRVSDTQGHLFQKRFVRVRITE
jgi:hypothetical protein